MSAKLSKAQAAVVQLMKETPDPPWWSQEDLTVGIQRQVRRSTLGALVRRGILRRDRVQYTEVWRLVPEAERVPVADLDIPF